MAGIELCGVTKEFPLPEKNLTALSKVDLKIGDGEFVTLVGKSGCGKTTLLRLIAGLEQPTYGAISFVGSVHTEGGTGRARVSMVFQEPRLMPWLTVADNLALPLLHERNRREVQARVQNTLKMLGMTSFEKAYPSQLSGGMAQRVSLGRTLCYGPDIILMDEPLGALDAFTRRGLQRELVHIFQQQRQTVLFVTHDVDEAVLLGQRVIIMDGGRIQRDFLIDLAYPRNPWQAEFCRYREMILEEIVGYEDREAE